MAITINGAVGLSEDATATLTNKTLASPIFTGQVTGLELAFSQSIIFEGITANDFETTFSAGDPTADRTITLPDATDTLVGKTTTDTLTNKSLSLTTNTITGTLAEFNTALSGDDFVSLTGAETLTNKTLTAPVMSSISNTGTITLPTNTDTLVGRATTDTLTNKTLTSPQISGLFLSDSSIIFEGSVDDTFETTLTITNPTADRTITFPDSSGTVAFSTSVDATISTLENLEIAVIMAAF